MRVLSQLAMRLEAQAREEEEDVERASKGHLPLTGSRQNLKRSVSAGPSTTTSISGNRRDYVITHTYLKHPATSLRSSGSLSRTVRGTYAIIY